ncbi:MAG: hypothetical protein BJ554DRAFT_1543, partial [Olpidium bornovanus]
PGGGDVKIHSRPVDFDRQAESKVDSRNEGYVRQGGDVKIFSEKMDFKRARSKVGSLENINYTPHGGDKKIFNQVRKQTIGRLFCDEARRWKRGSAGGGMGAAAAAAAAAARSDLPERFAFPAPRTHFRARASLTAIPCRVRTRTALPAFSKPVVYK